MARIPVARVPHVEQRNENPERGRRLPLWLLPIIPLLLGVIALGMSMTGANEQRDQTTTAPDQSAENNAAQGNTDANAEGATLTDMMVVVNERNPRSLAGRQALFANVAVQSVVGDRGVWVGPTEEEQLFVVIDDASVGQPEGAVQLEAGQSVTLGGTLERLPELDQAPPEWGLNANNSAAFEGQEVYLQAMQVIPGQ